MKLIIEIPIDLLERTKSGDYNFGDDLARNEVIVNGTPYNPTGDAISRSWVEHNVLSLMDVETRIYAKARLDNAPPVEQSEIWGEGFADGLATGAKWVGRPKGEWKRITEETANIQMFLCSVCGRKVEVGYSHISPSVYYPFCHCGADMRTEDK